MKNKTCRTAVVSGNNFGEIRFCAECQVITLSIQAITLRLTLDAYTQLSEIFAQTHPDMLTSLVAEHRHNKTNQQQNLDTNEKPVALLH